MDGLLAGLLIFDRLMPVSDPHREVSASHDVIHAGPDPDTVSDEDKAKLATVGWHVSEEHECFYYFT